MVSDDSVRLNCCRRLESEKHAERVSSPDTFSIQAQKRTMELDHLNQPG